MARRAKGLPVAAKPEEALVATMGNNVIDNGGGTSAHPARGVRTKIFTTGFTPLMVITAKGC